MSTLTSSDFGELKRPTTRVHAPPGGGSNWSFGDDTPAAPARGRQQQSKDVVMNSPPSAPAAAPAAPPPAPLTTTASASAQAAAPGVLRVALIKTAADAEIVDLYLQNCWDQLKQNPQLSAEVFTVPSLSEMPFAASKLLQFGGFDSVVCFGFLNTVDPLFVSLSSALAQSLNDVSLITVKPVVRAIFTGEPRTASVKAKGGWGAEFASSIDSLMRLGGFVGPIPSVAEGNAVHKRFQVSRGNVLPPRLLGASRSVVETLDTVRNSLYQHGAK
jgi:calcyphosin